MLEIDYDELERINTEMMADAAFRELSDRLVPGEGDNPIAFIVGEAPGATEEIKGRPFVGPAGQVQRDLMDIARLWSTDSHCDPSKPANCWLTNTVKFFPPWRNGNRKPTDAEIAASRPYLKREWIAVGRPQLIIAIGGVAMQAIVGRKMSILATSGREYPNRAGVHLWPMIHPSFGLRQVGMRALIEKDWESLARWMADVDYHG